MSEIYFSEKFLKKLSEIHDAGLTMIEAPAGYGKTTAVRYEMSSINQENVHWFTAVDFYQDAGLDWFIHEIGLIDEEAGKELSSLGYINRSNVRKVSDVLWKLKVKQPVYLIFDNFQLISHNWPPVLLSALADRKKDNLHAIFISQNFGKLNLVFENTNSIKKLKAEDFLLNRNEITEFAKAKGLEIESQTSNIIFRRTNGWVAAASLYIERLKVQNDICRISEDIDELLEELFWNKMCKRDQELVLGISVFDCINQNIILKACPDHAEELNYIISRMPMVYRDGKNQSGYPHEILRNFLMKKLNEKEMSFQHMVFKTAGNIFKGQREWKKAAEYYYMASDYEAVLGCSLTGLLNEDFGELNYTDFAKNVLKKSSDELLRKYPVTMLRLCYALYAGTDFESYERELERSLHIIQKMGDSQLLGEWHIVAALSGFPDIEMMKEHYEKASELMSTPSRIFTKEEPFMFGTSSMWYLFYREPGKMLETGEQLKCMIEVYDRITNNHGAGAYELYMSEALSVQGEFEESELYAQRAAVLAERWQNVTVTYGVALVLGINAVYQSDMISLQKAVDYLEMHAVSYPFMQHTSLNRQMAETVRTYLLGLMMEPDRTALWARGESDILGDLTFTNFMAKTNRITDLILKKKYKRAIASVEESLKLDERLISLSTRNFMYVGLSLCYLAIGAIPKAGQWLEKSLEIIGEDRNYTFIACFKKYLGVLFLLPGIKKKYGKVIKEIKELEIHYTKAEESHIFYMLEQNPEEMQILTEREAEVAKLVAEGFRNREIADKLFISEETVKSHIKHIFIKTNIDRRSKLVELLK